MTSTLPQSADRLDAGSSGARRSGPPVPIERLVLVYAAKSGLLAAVMDSARKLLKLDGCVLCTITHGATGERPAWTACRRALGVPVEVQHLDDMPNEVRALVKDQAPAVLAYAAARGHVVLLGPEAVAGCNESVEDLRDAILRVAIEQGLTFD